MREEPRTCERCGMQFYPTRTTARMATCPQCPIIVHRSLNNNGKRTRGHPSYDMALELVTIRIAFEMIEPLLKLGRRKEATEVYDKAKKIVDGIHPDPVDRVIDIRQVFEILEEVEAPSRNTSLSSFAEEDHEIDYEGLVLMEAENDSGTRGQ